MTLVADRVMIFHPSENGRFVKSQSSLPFIWNGEFIGEVSGMLNSIPAVKGNKLYYLSPANQYVILQRYDVKTHIIELVKRIYGLPMIPYNLCYFKNKQYIMYSYTPFNEIEYTLWQRKKEEINDSERLLFFFHWMLGIRGKIVRAYMDGHSGGSVIMSNGKYSAIDYSGTDMTQAKINKYFGTYRNFQNTGMYFNRADKIDAIRSLMTCENYWWFQEIDKRIRGDVISQQPLPYASTPSQIFYDQSGFQQQLSLQNQVTNNFVTPSTMNQNTFDFDKAIPYIDIKPDNIPSTPQKEEIDNFPTPNKNIEFDDSIKTPTNHHFDNPIMAPFGYFTDAVKSVSPNTRYSLFQRPDIYTGLDASY